MSDLPFRAQEAARDAGPADVQFVDGLALESDSRRGATKQHHKKSRNGCQRCKARRVKCDEARPVCSNCQRHAEACIYDRVISSTRGDQNPVTQSSKVPSPAADIFAGERPDLPETKARRLLELSLLHHYNIFTSHEMLTSGDEAAELAWIKSVPEKGFKNDALLHTMFAFSALHMSRTQPGDEQIMATHRRYLALGLSEHKADVTNLNVTNFDAVLLTSSLLRMISFAMLRERPLIPYKPPVQWLQMTRGAMNLFDVSWNFIEKDENSLGHKLTKRMPIVFDEEGKFAPSNREGFEHLLHRDEIDVETEPWPPNVMEAYETTLSYIGCILIAEQKGESTAEVCRRLLIFPYIVRSKYIDLVQEANPRALAILAHYFAVLHRHRSVWWVGQSGLREVHALQDILTGKWNDFMKWPLQRLARETWSSP